MANIEKEKEPKIKTRARKKAVSKTKTKSGAKKKIAVKRIITKQKVEKGEEPIVEKINEELKKEVTEVPAFINAKINKEKEGPKKKTVSAKGRSIGLYRKIAFLFLFLTAALLVSVFYFSFTKVDIVLKSKLESASNSLIFNVQDKDKGNAKDGAVLGIAKEIDAEYSKSYQPSESQVTGEEVTGQVTLINNYSRSQPLIATTRLLSADGKLYRLKNTVNVPAGGSIVADIYADSPSPDMAIGPTRFTIPGLWAGIQDKIYGQSYAPLVYQKIKKGTIAATDINNAVVDLKNSLLAKVKSDNSANFNGYDQMLYSIDDGSVQTQFDGKVGEEKDSFSGTIKAKVLVTAFYGNVIYNLAKEKMETSIPENEELVSLDPSNFVYTVTNFNVDQGLATINVNFAGDIRLKNDANIIDKNKIVGLTKDQLDSYLDSIPGIDSYTIKFSPPFLEKAPDLADRISIEVK